jgi:hypothetical protein
MKNLTFFFILVMSVTIGCQKDSDLITNTLQGTQLEQSIDIAGGALERSGIVLSISPSGDVTGQTDADNIEAALNAVKATGGTVHLTEGDFYTSRNIIVENFNGVLEGEGMEQTIIHAGRQSEEIGFEAAISPFWFSVGYTNEFANVLRLDNATGDVVITNLTILVKDDQPTDIIPDENGDEATYLSTFIEILGGEHNTVIENVRLEGKESEAFGNVQGMNAAYGIHVMLKPFAEKGKGNLTVRNVDIENTGWGAVLFMKYKDDSMISIDDVSANNVGQGILAGNINGSSVKISNMDISLRESASSGMWLFNIPSGLEVSGNSIANGNTSSIALTSVTHAQIVGNTIVDHQGCCPWAYGIYLRWGTSNNHIAQNKFINISGDGGGIFLWNNSGDNIIKKNDYKLSNLPGWTESTPNGPGAVLLGGDTEGNKVFEKFPPEQGVTLCEMVLDLSDDPMTPEYDGNNFIHYWKPCENLSERALMIPEDDIESQIERMRIHR